MKRGKETRQATHGVIIRRETFYVTRPSWRPTQVGYPLRPFSNLPYFFFSLKEEGRRYGTPVRRLIFVQVLRRRNEVVLTKEKNRESGSSSLTLPCSWVRKQGGLRDSMYLYFISELKEVPFKAVDRSKLFIYSLDYSFIEFCYWCLQSLYSTNQGISLVSIVELYSGSIKSLWTWGWFT